MLEEGRIHSGCSYLRGKCASGDAPLVVILGSMANWWTCRITSLSFLVTTPGLHTMKTQAQETWGALRTQIASTCPGPGSTPKPQNLGGVSRNVSQRRRYAFAFHFGKGKAHDDMDSKVTAGHVCR